MIAYLLSKCFRWSRPESSDTQTLAPTMGDKSHDSLVANDRPSIPRYVRIYKEAAENTPQLVRIESHSMITKAERSVCDFFKCCHNWDQNEGNKTKKKCFATKNTIFNFDLHLKEKHPSEQLFCIYCYDLQPTLLKKYPNHRYLVKHMLKRHRFRRFQCSNCLYRALTVDHVIVHQKLVHNSLFKKAISGVGSSADDGCKIFVCQAVIEDEEYPKLDHYYRKYHKQRITDSAADETKYQCLYCHFMNEKLLKVIEHCIEEHRDRPLLYFLPQSQSSASAYSLLNDFIRIDDIPVRPKQEPQDNCVSSTQKITDSDNDARLARKRAHSSPEETSPQSEPNVVPKKKRLSIESTTSSTNSRHSKQTKMCFFCDDVFTNEESAKTHMKSHVTESQESRVSKWIDTFVKSQKRLAVFEEYAIDRKKEYYHCPLCVRLATICNERPKYFESFSAVLDHFWEHCSWKSVKCKICQTYIFDNDKVIANHITENHEGQIPKKFHYLFDEDIKFDEKERSELEKKYIETQSNSIIESQIKKLSKLIKKESDEEKELIALCISKPSKVKIEKMPKLEYKEHWKLYNEYEDRKKKKNDNSYYTIMDRIVNINNQFGPSCSSSKVGQSHAANDDSLVSAESISSECDRKNESEENCNGFLCLLCNEKFRQKKEFHEHHPIKHPNEAKLYRRTSM